MKKQAGFTLVEVLVAIVLTSVIALVAHETLSLIIESNARVTVHEARRDADRGLRVLFEAALRNAYQVKPAIGPTFVLTDSVAPDGTPRDRLSFATRASDPPLSAAFTWLLHAQTSHSGLIVSAHAPADAYPITLAAMREVTGLDVQVAGTNRGEGWQHTWPNDRSLPRAVRVTFWQGTQRSSPLVVTLPVSNP